MDSTVRLCVLTPLWRNVVYAGAWHLFLFQSTLMVCRYTAIYWAWHTHSSVFSRSCKRGSVWKMKRTGTRPFYLWVMLL